MPKVVDRAERRREVAEAVWRVVQRDGVDRASVRNVAREAGLSMGSLRHYFATQSELMIFALQLIIDRIESRIMALDATAGPRRRAELVLSELLPMDAQRRTENEVWLAFTARAMVDPHLRALQDEAYDKLRGGCKTLVRGIAEAGRRALDVDLETDRMHALLDGLAVHAAMRPDLNPPEWMRGVIARHLDQLEAVVR